VRGLFGCGTKQRPAGEPKKVTRLHWPAGLLSLPPPLQDANPWRAVGTPAFFREIDGARFLPLPLLFTALLRFPHATGLWGLGPGAWGLGQQEQVRRRRERLGGLVSPSSHTSPRGYVGLPGGRPEPKPKEGGEDSHAPPRRDRAPDASASLLSSLSRLYLEARVVV
jgi:hypothetical protein